VRTICTSSVRRVERHLTGRRSGGELARAAVLVDTRGVAEPDDADVELLTRAFMTLSKQFDAVRAGDLSLLNEFWSPELRIENADGWPVPGTYDGYDGFRRWFDETFGEYTGYVPMRGEFTRVGDRIVACVHSRWSTPEGETVVPQVALLFQVREGRIARMDVFVDEDRARAAASLN
jgi:ketosteroid isomerase-like protein